MKKSNNIFDAENLKRIRVKNFFGFRSLKFESVANNSKLIDMFVYIQVYHHDTKEIAFLRFHKRLLKSSFKSTRQLFNAVRRLIQDAYCHEIDECLYFDDVRIYDPHKKK